MILIRQVEFVGKIHFGGYVNFCSFSAKSHWDIEYINHFPLCAHWLVDLELLVFYFWWFYQLPILDGRSLKNVRTA